MDLVLWLKLFVLQPFADLFFSGKERESRRGKREMYHALSSKHLEWEVAVTGRTTIFTATIGENKVTFQHRFIHRNPAYTSWGTRTGEYDESFVSVLWLENEVYVGRLCGDADIEGEYCGLVDELALTLLSRYRDKAYWPE